jgi:predicted O-methyltransferase YrrM
MTWHIPVKTEWMKDQSNHAPSMAYAQNIHTVASRLKDFNALEIGMAWGFSTLALLEAGAKHLLSVDPNVLAKGADEAKANGYTNHVWTVQRSEPFWAENESVAFDLVYVDGSHLYKDVVNDLYEAWKRLNKGGLLMIDDWEHKKNIQAEGDTTEYGVSLACFEFWKDHVSEITDVGIEGRVLWFKK